MFSMHIDDPDFNHGVGYSKLHASVEPSYFGGLRAIERPQTPRRGGTPRVGLPLGEAKYSKHRPARFLLNPKAMSNSDSIGNSERRRYPRLRTRTHGELHLRTSDRGAGTSVQLPVVIESLSPNGVGFSAHTDADIFVTGRLATVRVALGNQDVSLPVIMVRTEDKGSGTYIGSRIVLAAADTRSRHHFADWIVNKLREPGRAAPRGRGRVVRHAP